MPQTSVTKSFERTHVLVPNDDEGVALIRNHKAMKRVGVFFLGGGEHIAIRI